MNIDKYFELQKAIKSVYIKNKISKEFFEELQSKKSDELKRRLEDKQKLMLEDKDIFQVFNDIPINTQQQLMIAQLQNTLAVHDTDINAWINLANIYYDICDMQKALFAINKAWDIDSQNLDIINFRACILVEYFRAEGGSKSIIYEAIGLFESTRDQCYPYIFLIDYNLGNCYQALGDHEEAIKKYDQALSFSNLPESSALIWKNRGTSFFHLGDHVEEIKSYKNAIKFNPKSWEAFASWATTELYLSNFKRSKKLFLHSLKINPELESSSYGCPQIYGLAYAHWKLNELKESYLRVNQVLNLNPKYQNGILLKSHLISSMWRKDQIDILDALKFFKNRIIDNPEDWFARNELYLIYETKDYRKDYKITMKEIFSSNNLPPSLLYQYALILENENKIQDAILCLENAFQKSPDHHIIHKLADLKKIVGDYQNAISFYNLILHDMGDSTMILHSIAEYYHFLGDYKECIRHLSKGIYINPLDETAWHNLILSLIKLGENKIGYMFDDYYQKINSNKT
ncbi:MAG: tetratricopeptide repeat protein, partial [Candidatus Hodarchaeota archaeon]